MIGRLSAVPETNFGEPIRDRQAIDENVLKQRQ
jgi:hypothetical protein